MTVAPVELPRSLRVAASISSFAVGEAASRQSADAPALSTAAHAVPSGYFKTLCSLTINARRKGIIIRIPSKPPSTATIMTRVTSRSKPRMRIAGIVTPTPKAIDSPADPAVWVMLFSRTVESRSPNLESPRNRASEMTATGIDALTVKPTFRVRKSEDAPKTIPRNVPVRSARQESSRIRVSGVMNGSTSVDFGETGARDGIHEYCQDLDVSASEELSMRQRSTLYSDCGLPFYRFGR